MSMKWLHKFLKGISLSGVVFTACACYGSPEPIYEESGTAPMTFHLVSKTTGAPIPGIHIKSSSTSYGYGVLEDLGVTSDDGTCRVTLSYRRNYEGPLIRFEDEAGNYAVKDTTLADLRDRTIEVKLNPAD